jgi:hypothetical protein
MSGRIMVRFYPESNMRKSIFTTLSLIFLFAHYSIADEGMWLLPKIGDYNIHQMRAMGFTLEAEDVFSNERASLKDAIVNVGNVGSGSVVSAKGLVVTNHHVIYDHVQRLSTAENDYLTDGFWASSLQEELPAPGLTVSFLKSITDVTEEVKAEVAAARERGDRVSMLMIGRRIANEATRGQNLQGYLSSHYNGEKYYLFVYETFNDVRMVGVPPSSIGKYGGDTDNFMWPRHTGDFGFIRVYADANNQPADYAEDNVPYKPARFLSIDLQDIQENDFTMILGYPGFSQRYLSAAQVEDLIEVTHPGRIAARGKKLDIIMEDMLADNSIRLKYASKHFNASNGYKFSVGQLEQLIRQDIPAMKKQEEEDFMQWVSASPERQEKYGNALRMIEESVLKKRSSAYAHHLINEALMMGTEIYVIGIRANVFRKNASRDAADYDQLKKEARQLNDRQQRIFYLDYSPSTDQKVVAAMMKLVREELPAIFLPDIFDYVDQEFGGDIDRFVEELFTRSVLASSEKLQKFSEQPNMEIIDNDLVIKFSESIYNKAIELRDYNNELSEGEKQGSRLYMQALRERYADRGMYPDANFTMRMTYGKVLGYSPKDAVYYKPVSKLRGVAEKHLPGDYEFEAPEKLLRLFEEKNYGRYATDNGMPIAFLSDNDITGGNSGSPVLNKNGHLIGVAFDGNWESLAGDVVFLPEQNRSISVDMRYVLFVTDKFAGASHILRELQIIN